MGGAVHQRGSTAVMLGLKSQGEIMKPVKYRGVSSFIPKRKVSNGDLLELGFELDNEEVFFKGVNSRHWADEEETSVFMGIRAGEQVLKKTGVDPDEIDLIISSSIVGDVILPHPACGIQHGLKARKATAITLDTGCASFVSGLIYAGAMIRSGMFRKILVISISNFAGRAQSRLRDGSSSIPGDGAGAILVEAGEGEDDLLGWWEQSMGEHHLLFSIHALDEMGKITKFWEPHDKIAFFFDRGLVDRIKDNAREYVPLAMNRAIEKSGLAKREIDLFFTHQPNDFLVNFWRDDLEIPDGRHHHTLGNHGNLFQASIPTSMADAVAQGKLGPGMTVAMSSFALAGELAAGAVIRLC